MKIDLFGNEIKPMEPKRTEYFSWKYKPMFEFHIVCNDNEEIYLCLKTSNRPKYYEGNKIPDELRKEILFHLLNVSYWDSNIRIRKYNHTVKIEKI